MVEEAEGRRQREESQRGAAAVSWLVEEAEGRRQREESQRPMLHLLTAVPQFLQLVDRKRNQKQVDGQRRGRHRAEGRAMMPEKRRRVHY